MRDVLLILSGYLLGSMPWGYWLPRIVTGVNIRKVGSGNTGAANVWRTQGFKLGLSVALLDLAKGLAAALLGVWLGSELIGLLAGGLELRVELFAELEVEGLQVAAQGLYGRRTAEHDVRPRLRERGGKGDRVRGDRPALGELLPCRNIAAKGEPTVRQRLLNDHPEPGRMGFCQHRPHGALEQVPGRLNRVKDPRLEGALDRLSLVRAGDGQADR